MKDREILNAIKSVAENRDDDRQKNVIANCEHFFRLLRLGDFEAAKSMIRRCAIKLRRNQICPPLSPGSDRGSLTHRLAFLGLVVQIFTESEA